MFKDLILHDISRRMAELMAENLPHGLIIEGPSGTGVTTLAKALAKHVGSPELVILPKKKLKNDVVVDEKEGSILIEDIRQLYQQTRTRQPGQQVYTIDTGERTMTTSAQNAFLKLLEEPHQGLHFIITTHHFDQLLPTIVSRSQRISLLPVTDDQTTEVIAGLQIADAIKRARLAFVGRGLPALLRRLAKDEAAYNARITIMGDAKTMLGNDTYEKLKIIHRYKDVRADAITLLDDMNYQIKTIVRSQPNQKMIASIDAHLDARKNILSGGNIRLQLSSAVL